MLAPTAELDEVPDDEEVAGEAELLDDVELAVDRLPRPRPQRQILRRCRGARHSGGDRNARRRGGGSPSRSTRPGTGTAAATGRRGRGRTPPPGRSRRRARRFRGSGRSAAAAPRRRAGGRRRQPGARGRARRGCCARADGGEGGGEAALRRVGVVDVGGGDAADGALGGELGEGVVACRVERVAVIPQLDEHAVAPEGFDELVELAGCRCRPVGRPTPPGRRPCGSR